MRFFLLKMIIQISSGHLHTTDPYWSEGKGGRGKGERGGGVGKGEEEEEDHNKCGGGRK